MACLVWEREAGTVGIVSRCLPRRRASAGDVRSDAAGDVLP
jgi:hypothetical protein